MGRFADLMRLRQVFISKSTAKVGEMAVDHNNSLSLFQGRQTRRKLEIMLAAYEKKPGRPCS